jgi:phosphoribosylanthranilate isomerase
MFVKICGITSEEDALLSVALGADAVGFVFAPSVRQVTAQLVHDITRRLPPEILTIGVFRDEHPDRVVDIVHRSGVRGVQLHGHEGPDEVEHVSRHVRWVIKAFAAGTPEVREARRYGTDMVLLDASTPGSGSVFDWSLVADVPDGLRLILAGGLDPDNVELAVETVQPWGVDVSSGVERSPGQKDPLRLKAFIERARRTAATPYRGPDDVPYDWADDE